MEIHIRIIRVVKERLVGGNVQFGHI